MYIKKYPAPGIGLRNWSRDYNLSDWSDCSGTVVVFGQNTQNMRFFGVFLAYPKKSVVI